MPGNALWNSACLLSQCCGFQCVPRSAVSDRIPFTCAVKPAGTGFHFSVLISAGNGSQSTFCQLNQGDSIILGDLLTSSFMSTLLVRGLL